MVAAAEPVTVAVVAAAVAVAAVGLVLVVAAAEAAVAAFLSCLDFSYLQEKAHQFHLFDPKDIWVR